jgi:hypothetical protein
MWVAPFTIATTTAHRSIPHTLDLASTEIQQDSAQLLRRLKAAQRDLERVRRRSLPFATGSSGGRCDERIGRFCYWYDDEEDWTPSPDDERLVRHRETFLESLDSVAHVIPTDPWITAQRVRYLVEAGRMDHALQVTADCKEADWWCAALTGYILHHAGHFSAADSTFRSALVLMPERQRCEWNDLSLLLEGSVRGRYRDLPCGDRDDFERRFWWLADPFYGIPGNERRSEHFYRLVLNALLEESASPRRMRWGNDNRELLVRFGGPIGWEQQRLSGSMSISDASVIAYHRNGGRQFVPPPQIFEDPTTLTVGEWDIDPERPRSRFAIPRFARYAPIEYQVAAFKRGDSAVVVLRGGWLAPRADSGSRGEIAFALVPNENTRPTVAIGKYGTPLQLRVNRQPALASVELWNDHDSIAGRDRSWIDLEERLPTEFGVSDILLLEDSDSLPETLEQAIPLTRSNLDALRGERLGLYWEVYGVPAGPEVLQFTLTVDRLHKSFFRRAAEWAGIVGRRVDTVRLRWNESVTAIEGINSFAVGVQLQDHRSGEYALTLTVQRANGVQAHTERRLVVH